MGASTQYSLNTTDWKKWTKNLLLFLIPLAIIYLVSVIDLLRTPGHLILLKDFIPTQVTIGAMVLYFLNALLDLAKKFLADNNK